MTGAGRPREDDAAAGEQPIAPYLDALVAYGLRGPGRFTVPGHKGGPLADDGLRHALGDRALALDVALGTYGVDSGREPSPLARAEQLAADAFGARRSWFLTNGATQGNHALCLALAGPGVHVVVQRNAHASLVDGLVLSGGMPAFVAPEYDAERGMAHVVTPAALAATLDALAADGRPAAAAFIVSPTYYGMCADVGALAEVCDARGVPLVVDQAWGPHFGFHPDVPASALDSGASAVLTSTHKITGSLTQSAILHVAARPPGRPAVDPDHVGRMLRLLRSTSPSSLLMGSLDGARRHLAVHGEALLHETVIAAGRLRARIAAVDGLEVVDEAMVGRWGIADYDPARVVIDTRALGATGYAFADALRRRYDAHVELATQTTVVCVLGFAQRDFQLGRLAGDVEETAARLRGGPPVVPVARDAAEMAVGEMAVAPRDAFLADSVRIPVAQAPGRISCESIAGYPPGIPAILPGERVTAATVDYLRRLVAGGAHLHGASDPAFATMHVLADDGGLSPTS